MRLASRKQNFWILLGFYRLNRPLIDLFYVDTQPESTSCRQRSGNDIAKTPSQDAKDRQTEFVPQRATAGHLASIVGERGTKRRHAIGSTQRLSNEKYGRTVLFNRPMKMSQSKLHLQTHHSY